MKTYILKIENCFFCPNYSPAYYPTDKKIHFHCEIGYKDEYGTLFEEIPNFPDIPKWCPIPNWNEEIIDDFLYELSLTDEDRKKMREVAKNPDGSNKTEEQFFKEE